MSETVRYNTVAQLVSRGDLARHSGGGVQVAAVISRVIRLGQRR